MGAANWACIASLIETCELALVLNLLEHAADLMVGIFTWTKQIASHFGDFVACCD